MVQKKYTSSLTPNCNGKSPKDVERICRDSKICEKTIVHDFCQELTESSKVPRPWNNVLNCRKCKRKLANLISEHALYFGKNSTANYTLITAGGFDDKERTGKAWQSSYSLFHSPGYVFVIPYDRFFILPF